LRTSEMTPILPWRSTRYIFAKALTSWEKFLKVAWQNRKSKDPSSKGCPLYQSLAFWKMDWTPSVPKRWRASD
jgi:hypothetical protein